MTHIELICNEVTIELYHLSYFYDPDSVILYRNDNYTYFIIETNSLTQIVLRCNEMTTELYYSEAISMTKIELNCNGMTIVLYY